MSSVKIKHEAVAEVEAALVRRVRLHEAISRVELSRQLNLAPSTVGLYVDRLIDEGVLREGIKAHRAAGRPPKLLELSPEAGEFVGVDFDARQIAVAAVDFSQRVVRRHNSSLRATDGVQQVIEKLQQAIAAVVSGSRLLGIGLAVPGTIDTRRGVALHYGHIPGWKNVALVERLAEHFAVPIYLENNIRAMAMGERWFGAARRVADFVCLGIRSGIGAGVVIDGRLHRGHADLAGEIGGWPCSVEFGSAADADGQRSTATLEQVASVRAILARLTTEVRAGASSGLVLRRNKVSVDEMLRCARLGDALVVDALASAAQAVGQVMGGVCLLLNPQKIIVAGPLSELAEAFVEPLARRVAELTRPLHDEPPRIVASDLGDYGGALGAAALAVNDWKPERS